MALPAFDYYRAHSVDEALALAAEHPEAVWLAGGHSLIPLLNVRLAYPGALIDIGPIVELTGIRPTPDGGWSIGALTTHAMLAANVEVPPVLAQAAAQIGDPQVRNRGTLGGNVAHADPAADYPPVLLALEAAFTLRGPTGQRNVTAANFFQGLFTTALQEGELLTEVRLAAPPSGSTSAYAKLAHPASGYALVGAAAVLVVEQGRCTQARVAVGGATPTAVRAPRVEAALIGQTLNEANLAAAAATVEADLGDELLNDHQASAAYRRRMATVYVKRALTQAATDRT
ncbi:MAG: xanthine dehydrogenase family protein subunit M [Candidatus Promineifilaceae bacterium]|nr:xanthine dehydrogenase family protein subunit M [Candidatus Promineifilaceae bacterium]